MLARVEFPLDKALPVVVDAAIKRKRNIIVLIFDYFDYSLVDFPISNGNRVVKTTTQTVSIVAHAKLHTAGGWLENVVSQQN